MRNPFFRAFDLLANMALTSCVGNRKKVIYTGSYKSDGSIRLEPIDELDIQDEINSHLHETDMSVILSKLMSGDVSAIRQRLPMYGDFTQFPTSYVEMLDLVQKGSEAFDMLPAEVRVKFDNDRSKWFSSIGSDEWNLAMGNVSQETLPGNSSPEVESE